MRTEPARQLEPFAAPAPNRELLVEVYGPLFAAIGRLSLSAPVRLSDFVNEREGFLRLTDVEFMPDGARSAPGQPSPPSAYLINKTGIELVCQPSDETVERRSSLDPDSGKSLWQAFGKMALNANSDLHVPKERHKVQLHTHRFTVSAYLHMVQGADIEAMLSHLPTKFVPVTDATARFVNPASPPATIERKLMLVNRDHILLIAVG
jgi:hypothetical protein